MIETNPLKTYPSIVARLRDTIAGDKALEAAVGGDFITVGKLEAALLNQLGLGSGHQLVDVGCGSGRLALQLATSARLNYLGTDIVQDLLDHARKLCARPDWRFEISDGISIPLESDRADFVCFFSVFTHLTHEDSFRYLREAKRVLRPGGKIVFSFLEFFIYSHWTVFELSVEKGALGDHLNQFIGRDGIQAWAHHLGLIVEALYDGDKPHIPIREPLVWQNGRTMTEMGELGQSVAVFRKPQLT